MKRLGTVLHLSVHGNLIVRLDDPAVPRMRSKVVTKKMERIGTVYDIFGPEQSPYVSVRPDRGAKNVRSLINERVYVV